MKKKPEPKGEPEEKKIKNPPIKLAPQADFIKRAEPFYQATLDKCEEGKPWFTKELCQEFWEGALDRDLVPEVWDGLWEKLPKWKTDATGELDVMEPSVAYKKAIDRGIEIGMCYTRLRTAMDKEWTKIENPETDLLDFFINGHCSDVTIKHPFTEAVYK
jgi:hypothetical protein